MTKLLLLMAKTRGPHFETETACLVKKDAAQAESRVVFPTPPLRDSTQLSNSSIVRAPSHNPLAANSARVTSLGYQTKTMSC